MIFKYILYSELEVNLGYRKFYVKKTQNDSITFLTAQHWEGGSGLWFHRDTPGSNTVWTHQDHADMAGSL